MKTLKITEKTHNRLTLFKNILNKKTLDEAINEAIDCAIENLYEYDKEFGEKEYGVLNNDK